MSGWLSEDATQWAGRPVARTAAAAHPRERVHLCATVMAVRSRQAGAANGPLAGSTHGAVVEATVNDGTATLTLRWLGRAEIPGMVPGAVVEVEGTLASIWGQRIVLNPLYRFLRGPVAPG